METLLILIRYFSENISIVFIIIAVVLLLICGGKTYLNIFGIINSYFNDFIRGNALIGIALYISPILISLAICLSRTITADDIEIITVAISILIALFFTFLSSFTEKKKNLVDNEDDYSKFVEKNIFLNENIAIVSYEILLCIIILICCFIFSFLNNIIIAILIYSLYIHLILNLLIIVKRYAITLKTD